MIRKYVLPLLAVAGVVFAIYTVKAGSRKLPVAEPLAEPPTASYEASVAGAGLVEAATENIAVGTPVAGVVAEVFARVGDKVNEGDPLFRVDGRDLKAELAVREAALETAARQLEKLQNQPRPEEVAVSEAKLAEAEVRRAEAQRMLQRWQRVEDRNAVTEEEVSERRLAADVAAAQVKQAKADLALLKAGAWERDELIAAAEVASARARVQAAKTDLDRLTVRAPQAGTVLQVKVRPGEFAAAGVMQTPLMILGRTDVLHVRVDVDEHDAPRLAGEPAATASVRGGGAQNLRKIPLAFVRVEPYIVPKRSLTGDSTERVDTRVLQILYSYEPDKLPFRTYVGQQMDVSIDAGPPAAPATAPAGVVDASGR